MGKYHKRIQVEGSDEFDLAVNITGKGAPTEDTEAEPGMVYMDEDSENGDLYKCISRTETEEKVVHTWKKMPSQEEVDSLSKAINERYIPTYTLAKGEMPEDAPEWAEEVIDPYNDPEGGGYILTDEDKQEIAEIAAGMVDTALLSIIGTGEVTA